MRIDCEEELDERLAHRMRRGEGLAFATLTTRYWHLVHRICSNLLPSAAEARETTEEIFLQMSLPPASFPPDVPFRTSLLKLGLQRVLARRRSAALPGEGSEAFLPGFDTDGRLTWAVSGRSPLTGMPFSAPALRKQIRDALRHLHELDHASFVLREVEGIPIDEVAAILEIPPRSVRQRTHRAALMLTGALRDLVSPTASSGLSRYAS